MKKKQNYNPLQLSFFDEVVTRTNGDKDGLLEKNWKSVVDHFAQEGNIREKEKQSTYQLKTENHERDLSESSRGNGQDYLMLTSDETELISELPWKGRVIYEMLKEQQPKRFLQMKQSGELIPFLQKISKNYYDRMNHHIIDNGMMETEAEELEWPALTKTAGLS